MGWRNGSWNQTLERDLKMRKDIVSTFIMIFSIVSILGISIASAHAGSMRHEFQRVSVASGPDFQNVSGLPSCEAPMVLFTVPADGIVYTAGEDIQLTKPQSKAVRYFVEELGSATVCQDNGALVITGQF